MENEIVSHATASSPSLRVAAGRPGLERSGHLRDRRRREHAGALRGPVRAGRRAARRDRDARRALAPRRGAAGRGRATSPQGDGLRDAARRAGAASGWSGRRRRACSSSAVRVAHAGPAGSRSSCAPGERAGEVRRIELVVAGRARRRRPRARRGSRRRAARARLRPRDARRLLCAARHRGLRARSPSSSAPDELWLSSHQGGHRFAANVLVLPAGIQLGRVAPEDAPRTSSRDALAGRIDARPLPRAYRLLGARAGRRAGGARGPRLDVARGPASSSRPTATACASETADGREHTAVVEEHAGPTRAGELRRGAGAAGRLVARVSSERGRHARSWYGVVGDPDEHLARAPRAACRRR